jgi:hypothetical protein
MTYSYGFSPYFHSMYGDRLPYNQPAQNNMIQYVNQILPSWESDQKQTAQKIINKYGYPNEATPSMLIWYNNGVWKRTILYKNSVPHNFPIPHPDYLEQTIHYKVPLDLVDDVIKFDGSVIIDRTKGEVSARCDKEPMNFLALNLMHDIAAKKRTVQNARKFYAKTAMEYGHYNQSSPYIERLLFNPIPSAADPDNVFGSIIND